MALHRGETTGSFDDEAQGKGDVAVCRGSFPGLDELQAGVEGVGCVRRVECRVDELEDSAFGFLVGYEFTRREEERSDLSILPEMWDGFWVGDRWDLKGRSVRDRLKEGSLVWVPLRP